MIENNPFTPDDFEPTNEEVEDFEWVVDDTPDYVYLQVMCDALTTADGFNAMTGADEDRKKRIMRKALIVIDRIVDDIYKDFINRDSE